MTWPVFQGNKYAAEVDVNEVPHLVGREFLDAALVVRGAGIHDKNVNLSVLLFYGRKTIGYLLFVRRIAPNEFCADVAGNLLATVTAAGDGYRSTVIDEIAGNGQSDAASATGYQRNFSC
jgi:hypothetical protein